MFIYFYFRKVGQYFFSFLFCERSFGFDMGSMTGEK